MVIVAVEGLDTLRFQPALPPVSCAVAPSARCHRADSRSRTISLRMTRQIVALSMNCRLGRTCSTVASPEARLGHCSRQASLGSQILLFIQGFVDFGSPRHRAAQYSQAAKSAGS